MTTAREAKIDERPAEAFDAEPELLDESEGRDKEWPQEANVLPDAFLEKQGS